MSLKYKIRYLKDYLSFKKAGGVIDKKYPIYSDYKEQAGAASGHYFHQDLLVADAIFKANPTRHIDVGSSISGFVSHVAAFREIEVIDVRPLKDTGHKNIKFQQMDMMDGTGVEDEITDSISCLHAIEHFGLGRYGDPIDPKGHIKGFLNLLKMLKPNGILYISFPIASKSRIEFNAHRVFEPTEILNWQNIFKIELLSFSFVDDAGDLHENQLVNKTLETLNYGCGIYNFKKID
jgi:hypothetical protein